MFVLMIIQFVVMIIVFMKLGPEGRFILKANLSRGGAILLSIYKTGHTAFHLIRSWGENYKIGKKVYIFTSKLVKDPSTEDERKLNQEIRSKAMFGGKPFYLGSMAARVSVSPQLARILEKAKDEDGYKEMAKYITKLLEKYPEGTEINFVQDYELDNVTEFLKETYTGDEIDEVQREGYLMGINLQTKTNMVLLIMTIIMTIAVLVMAFFMTWKG